MTLAVRSYSQIADSARKPNLALIKNPSQNILFGMPWLHSIRAVRFVRPGEPGRIPVLR